MAKKATAPKRGTDRNTGNQSYLRDCKHARWVETHQNKDWKGKYICLTCPFEQWHILRGRKACAEFEPKPKDVQP